MAEPERAPSKDLARLRPALKLLAPYKGVAAAALGALLFTASVTLSMGQGLRFMIDRGLAAGSHELLNRSVAVFLVLVVLLAVGTFVRFYLVSWLGERVSADLRKAVFNNVIQLHPSFFETNSGREIQTRLTTDTTLLQTVIGSSVSIALRNTLLFIGGIVLLVITNPKLTALVLCCVPLVVGPILFFGRRVRRLSRTSQDRVASVGSYVGETLSSIKTVQAHNHEPHDRAILADHAEAAFDIAVIRIRQRAFLSTLVIFFVLGAVGALIWVGGQDVLAGRLSGGELAAFVFYAFMVAAAVGAISEVIGDLQRAAGATERLVELLEMRSEIQAPAVPTPLPVPVRGALEIDCVRFAYPSRPESPAVDGLTLTVEPGSRVALVGPSGAGKSTLFELLLRFHDPQEGVLRLDGVDIRELDPAVLRRHVAIVAQQPVLFDGSVADNIRYGRPDANDADLRSAARSAYAAEFIDRLPQGYETQLGDAGVRLSGGQRQRISIARALLRDPEVLLLDEATSALDAESEAVVQRALDELMKGRTTLVIAHRLATVVDAHRIVVLEQGRIVASGRHAELMGESPLYARLAELQFNESRLSA